MTEETKKAEPILKHTEVTYPVIGKFEGIMERPSKFDKPWKFAQFQLTEGGALRHASYKDLMTKLELVPQNSLVKITKTGEIKKDGWKFASPQFTVETLG